MDKQSADHGKVLDGVSSIWEQKMRWETLKSSGSTPSDGSNASEKETLRSQRRGSVIEFWTSLRRRASSSLLIGTS